MLVEVLTQPAEALGFEQPAVLILGRPTCDDCIALYAELAEWTPSFPVDVFTLDLTTEAGASLRIIKRLSLGVLREGLGFHLRYKSVQFFAKKLDQTGLDVP